MKLYIACLCLTLLYAAKAQQGKCAHAFKDSLPLNSEDFNQPHWANIIELAFPPWKVPAAGCPRLDKIGGTLEAGFETYPTPENRKFNPCYYTKAFAGLDPMLGGYPTPIDTKYPYEFAAPFLRQPGDGSTHHCPMDAPPSTPVQSCPKVGTGGCGKGVKDCNMITDEFGIGHVPPFVPLAAVKNAFLGCKEDVCSWFDDDVHKCNIPKSVLDRLVVDTFEVDGAIKFTPPKILADLPPSDPKSTYYKLEYLGDPVACADDNCRGPHYCSKAAAEADIWGDFCPYIHTGENSGLYRHPHVALAALELFIANKCKPKDCPATWLDSPNAKGYGENKFTSTSITWSQMEDNNDPMAQPSVPYVWPNSGDGIYPGHELYGGKMIKKAPGSYVLQFVAQGSVDAVSHTTTKAAEETVSSTTCTKCGTIKKTGKLSCCANGGAWFDNCGKSGDSNFEHTWVEGIQACKKKPSASTTATTIPSSKCSKCGTLKKSGKLSCCADDGAWFDKCGKSGDSNFEHTWNEGIDACKSSASTTATTVSSTTCTKCGTYKKSGKLSCCARGGAWFNKCGDPGDSSFDHTWFEGIQACKDATAEAQGRKPSIVLQKHLPRLNYTQHQSSDSAFPAATGIIFNAVTLLVAILIIQ